MSDPNWNPSRYAIGQAGGVENVTLNQSQIPPHTHPFTASTQAGTSAPPIGGLSGSGANSYGAAQNLVPLGGGPLTPSGNQPHANLQPLSISQRTTPARTS